MTSQMVTHHFVYITSNCSNGQFKYIFVVAEFLDMSTTYGDSIWHGENCLVLDIGHEKRHFILILVSNESCMRVKLCCLRATLLLLISMQRNILNEKLNLYKTKSSAKHALSPISSYVLISKKLDWNSYHNLTLHTFIMLRLLHCLKTSMR